MPETESLFKVLNLVAVHRGGGKVGVGTLEAGQRRGSSIRYDVHLSGH